MSLSAPASESAELPPLDLAEAGAYATVEEAAEHGLVVLAMGHPYWLVPDEAGHHLLVEGGALCHVREQLGRFERERRHWPPKPLLDLARHETDAITPLLWAVGVLGIFELQATHPQWVARGAMDAHAVFEGGEWWRAATALWLHGDGGHVISNALGGIFIFIAVLKTFGRLRGWLSVVAAAMLGNLAAAGLHYPHAYRSLGASTAIFAGVGLLTGRALRVAVGGASALQRWYAVLPPLGSGIVLLALYGSGGYNTDIGAHLTGFAAGVVVGFGGRERKFSDGARDGG